MNGPEILNKFVGASEENIRNLFKEAEDDTIANGDNADLHIIIFDEVRTQTTSFRVMMLRCVAKWSACVQSADDILRLLLFLNLICQIDAICKVRGRGGDSTGVHDTVVNQLLSKIDGVNALNNILVIGMTNRKGQ